MKQFGAALILCLAIFCGCGEEETGCLYPAECQFVDDGFFELESLNMEFEDPPYRRDVFLDASLIETPADGESGQFVLRDEKGVEYQFVPVTYESEAAVEWEDQLSALQLGKNYHFEFYFVGRNLIVGMKVFDHEILLYLGASYIPRRAFSPFLFTTGLEGFTVEQQTRGLDYKSELQTRVKRGSEYLDNVILLPVMFTYGSQSIILEQTEEAVFTTPDGQYLVHLLRSVSVNPMNYDNGWDNYSFYIRKL